MANGMIPGGGAGAWDVAPAVYPEMTGAGGGGFGQSMSNLFGDRNFLNLLAGIGSNLDPTGAGGAIGKPTQSMIQSLAMQEAMGEQEAKRTKFNEQLLSILGGLTDKELPGPTSLKATNKGITLDLTPPGTGGLGTTGTSAGAGNYVKEESIGTPSRAWTANKNISDVIPFY